MDCREVETNDITEAYVAGRLTAAQAEAFEEHYFECDACFARLEACRALRSALSRRRNGHSVFLRPTWAWTWLVGIAAALIVAVLWGRHELLPPAGFARRSDTPPPRSSRTVSVKPSPEARPQSFARLELLGRLKPPTYSPVEWRNGSSEAQERFRSGMARYAEGDYAGAIPDLEHAVSSTPDFVAAHFYLGICRLLTRDVEGGIESLKRAIEIGDTPFLESARFHLAKGFLLKTDRVAAKAQLRRVIDLKGDFEGEARELLREIDEALQSRS